MKKIYIKMEEVRDNSFILAKRMVDLGIEPTILYAVVRGGVYVANPISEYYSLIGKKVKYGVVNAHSYKGVNEQGEMVIEGWVPPLKSITKNDKIVIVDDIADSRKTLEALIEELEKKTPLKRRLNKNLKENDIIIVTHDFKIYEGAKDNPKTRPDLFVNKWFVKKGESMWIFYLSHEVVGMNKEEIKKYYPILCK